MAIAIAVRRRGRAPASRRRGRREDASLFRSTMASPLKRALGVRHHDRWEAPQLRHRHDSVRDVTRSSRVQDAHTAHRQLRRQLAQR
jgi:hypothetical protein